MSEPMQRTDMSALIPALEDDGDPTTFRLAPGDRSLVGSTQEGRDFMFAILRYVDMSDADFYWASFQHSVLEGAVMARCDLRGAHFNGANMRGAELRHANLGLDNIGGTTQLEDVDLTGADLRNAFIAGANFRRAKLVGADLRGANAVCDILDRATPSAVPTSPTQGLAVLICELRSMTRRRAFRVGSNRRRRGWSRPVWAGSSVAKFDQPARWRCVRRA